MEDNNRTTVYNIFADFFGEDNVDLQNDYTIIVHFPKVTVTNEHNRSIDITHLWVRVQVLSNGKIEGSFKMMRSEITDRQFRSGYSHSHINHINSNNFNIWATPCLGTGPIRNTILSLTREYSEEMWELFCLELSKYVTVESLEGVPYIKLEEVGNSSYRELPVTFTKNITPSLNISFDAGLLSSFISFILQDKPFGFNYFNGSYGIAMSEKDILVVLSNMFIKWYNGLPPRIRKPKQELLDFNILLRCKLKDNELVSIYQSSSETPISELNGRELFWFKGNPICFNIIHEGTEEDPNECLILSPNIVGVIIDRILRMINTKYENNNGETLSSEEEYRYL